ncbi:uncharacterized protein BO87DRAFT_401373 [Aspergillus neoniger CBS 115656]|uniref:Uncharacterized protein n=1 Tax=Aspergillus neoniger (strain CBS 115656) TaxID=1448310 RepID=A0A318Y5C6_ASPNB|nr:hypothetical protein BO87DRAFT_401373 [Aspergillus neoniger CBS 115656]PYH29456.1 hypothetical protein BO87DRAFT_401373 [Aspergillus neoniger CBS 115656]
MGGRELIPLHVNNKKQKQKQKKKQNNKNNNNNNNDNWRQVGTTKPGTGTGDYQKYPPEYRPLIDCLIGEQRGVVSGRASGIAYCGSCTKYGTALM